MALLTVEQVIQQIENCCGGKFSNAKAQEIIISLLTSLAEGGAGGPGGIVSEFCVQEAETGAAIPVTVFEGSGRTDARTYTLTDNSSTAGPVYDFSPGSPPVGMTAAGTPKAGTHALDKLSYISADFTEIRRLNIASGLLVSQATLSGFHPSVSVIEGLETHPITGEIWAISDGPSNSSVFYKVNVDTGVLTQQGTTATSTYQNRLGFAFNGEGRLFIISQNPQVGNPRIDELDPATFAYIQTIYEDPTMSTTTGLTATQNNTLLYSDATGIGEVDLAGNKLRSVSGLNAGNLTSVPDFPLTLLPGDKVYQIIDTTDQTVMFFDSEGNEIIGSGLNLADCCCATDGTLSEQLVFGDIPETESFTKFGRNPDIDTGTGPEDIWSGGGLYTGQPIHSAAAETVEVFSSSANDAAAGTGARTVEISGLDENWMFQEEVVTLNGVTAVPTTTLWKRVNRGKVLTAGSTGNNEGIIEVRHTATVANVFLAIPVGQGQSTVAAYTVPEGKIFRIKRIKVQIGRANGSAGSAEYSIRVREEGGVYRAIRYDIITTAFPDSYTLVSTIDLPPRTDILVRIEDVSDDNTQASAAFEGYLVDV